MSKLSNKNAIALSLDLNWFAEILHTRIALHTGQEAKYQSISEIPSPNLSAYPSTYSNIVQTYQITFEERIVLLLAIAPHIVPETLDILFITHPTHSRTYTEFGGFKGTVHNGFLPTLETALFILAGKRLDIRFSLIPLFENNSFLQRYNLIKIGKPKANEPKWSAPLHITEEALQHFTSGEQYRPDFSSNFPAERLTTKMDWNDLVLENHVVEEVKEIQTWLQHKHVILNDWGMNKRLKPGYRVLFYGPPGTGKTLTATLLGKSLGLDVYRIDLSQVVSKYIGETEKNMANIFDQAENKNWILFFDEADALFGQRTVASDSKDRHANQEIAYLLQRVESFPGVVILATNLKGNIDEAFSRRFQSMIYFPKPNYEQRLQLWQTIFPKEIKLAEDVNFRVLARKYEITGGTIINVARYCALVAVKRPNNQLEEADILQAIAREYAKEGRTI